MPLPNILNGTGKRCRARTKSRNLAPCLNLAAWDTPVCTKHGAVHPDKRPKGKAHGKYKHGNETVEAVIKRNKQLSILRNLEDVLFVLGAIEGKQHTRGRKPADYENIQTIEQAQDFIIKLEEKKHLIYRDEN
jgi:hypothetical protein